MVFIDDLAFSLFTLSFAGLLLFYTIASLYFVYKKQHSEFKEYLGSSDAPLMVVGLLMVVSGLWGQFTWPLPGSYNILFYDPYLAFGILLVAFALSVREGVRLEYSGFLGLMVGAMTIVYGVVGYNAGLTQEPVALLLMYLFYGLAGIFAYPVSLIADRLPGLMRRNLWPGWNICLVAFGVFLVIASLLAAFVGVAALPAHLATPP
jgi:putative membrane protein